MSIIILTKNKEQGLKLRDILKQKDRRFEDIPCLVKEDIIQNPENSQTVISIFSTWYMPIFSESEIQRYFPLLKAIYYVAGTVKYFAEPFLNLKIKIYSASTANCIPVAEFTVAQILLANKGYFQAQRAYRFPIWRKGFNAIRKNAELRYGNYGATVGIIGCGAIGSKVVELLKPHNLKIIVYDPYVSDERIALLGVKRVQLNALFATADVITNHLPDTPETRGLIGYDLFSQMKKTATFINTGRGAQVVEKDLSKILRKNPNISALLDVTKHEPLYPWSPLFWNKNVFLSPHLAGSISNEYIRMVDFIVQIYHNDIQGIKNNYEISLELLQNKA